MARTIDGIPKSTWYYRRAHPPRLEMTFTEAARLLGITRQTVYRTARKLGVKTAQEVLAYYRQQQARQVSWEIVD